MKMGEQLLGEIQQLQASKRQGALCSVKQVVESLKDEEQSAFNMACSDVSIDGVTISTWLQKRGHVLKPWTINRHRRGQCSCPR